MTNQSMPNLSAFERPFPALTAAERYHLEVFGYVVVPQVLNHDECATIYEALRKIKRVVQAPEYASRRQAHEPFALHNKPYHVFMGGILEADPSLTAFATHPRLVGMAEELPGGEARFVEFNAHINSRNPEERFDKSPTYDFHRGTDVPFGSHTKNGLYHCNFVKTLTTLVDLGPEDGGTVVIVGSHKLDLPVEDMIRAAYEDRSLIHQVIAPAGSSLLFNETLIHATGQIRSDKERAVIVCGYGASMFPFWDGGEMSESFKHKIPECLQTFFLGKAHWTRGARYRNLDEPVDSRTFTLADGWWPGVDANASSEIS